GHLGELTQIVPFEMVDAALAHTRTVQIRIRGLPSRVSVLVPQLEQVVRVMLRRHNVHTLFVDEYGVESEKSLNALLEMTETEDVFWCRDGHGDEGNAGRPRWSEPAQRRRARPSR